MDYQDTYGLRANASFHRQRFNHVKTIVLLISSSFFIGYIMLATAQNPGSWRTLDLLRFMPPCVLATAWSLYCLSGLQLRAYRTVPDAHFDDDERLRQLYFLEVRQTNQHQLIDALSAISFIISLVWLALLTSSIG
ncbi:Hypothetical protein NGAL_HAMBI1146_00380 [Neorhizobium galegae bv. officinalis]|nr:Hypothetical protein NGAL_HAMBI1146_00380 [Neorhizobium galegae bv. officinalis]